MIFKNTDVNPPDKGAVLLLQVPRNNEKKELATEQVLAAIHGLLTKAETMSFFASTVHEKISFEIATLNGRICFFIWTPEHLKQYVQDQVYAQYPSVHISEVEDYALHNQNSVNMTCELKLAAPDPLPIKTFPSFEVDPLAGVTATLAQLEEGENAWIQLIARPAQSGWYKKSEHYAQSIRGGTKNNSAYVGLWGALSAPPEQKTSSNTLAEHESVRARAAEEKSHKLAYQTTIRIIYSSNSTESQARMRLQSIIASFKQFNSTYLNGFVAGKMNSRPEDIIAYQNRSFSRKTMILNIEELASVYHLPHTNVETPNILWANATTAEPPANLPVKLTDEISPIAVTNFRGHNTLFGLTRTDRGRHVYIIGQTGTGKSGLLELLTICDIATSQGFAVIDPHGDYALSVLRSIPESRVNDVIYFNPADSQYPIAFNPLEVPDPKLKSHTCSELIGVLKRMFDSWGPRLEYILRYSILALLDYPEATMLDITKILTDKKFRTEVLKHVTDPVVKQFWTVEFASWNDKFAAEAVAPVLNKVGAFTANPLVRNIVGQPHGSFNIRKIMDERKILIVNLSRGLIGEDNASLLGSLMVTKIQMAAMSRADVSKEARTPFYLYVDEFQNFATDSFATILSEARKYSLNLTVANQYTAQMMQSVRDAVFGNVGTVISFRTSADDARSMLKYFEPKFTDYDLVHMHNRHFVTSMTIEGEKVQAFSAVTKDLEPLDFDNSEAIIAKSRELYASDIGSVENYIDSRYDLKTLINQKPVTSVKKPKNTFQNIPKPPQPINTDLQTVESPTTSTDSPEANFEKSPEKSFETIDDKLEIAPKDSKQSVIAALARLAENAATKAKRKRKRTRKRKNKQDQPKAEVPKVKKKPESEPKPKPQKTQPVKQPEKKSVKKDNFGSFDDEVVIKLR